MRSTRIYLNKLKRSIMVTLMSLVVLSCGTETAIIAGISGTGITGTGTVWGVITGFGSIFVNGIEYDIDDATIEVDGEQNATQNQLAIGMYVRLEAVDNGDGTGVAASVLYDDVVEGPIESIEFDAATGQKTLGVFGYSVVVDETSTTFEGVSFATLEVSDLVEISGFTDLGANRIFATRLQQKGSLQIGSEIELKGLVENLVEGVSFTINGITIDISQLEANDISDLDNGLANGVFVEVEGRYQDSNLILAEEVEGEDDFELEGQFEEGEELSLQGIVTRFVSVADFDINGNAVDASALDAQITSQIALNVLVHVEGILVDGVLIAEQIEIDSEDDEFESEEDEFEPEDDDLESEDDEFESEDRA